MLKLILKDLAISVFFTIALFVVLYLFKVNPKIVPYIGAFGFLVVFSVSSFSSFYLFKLKMKIDELNSQINKILKFDERTDIYKREYFFEMAKKYLHTAKKKNLPLSVVIFDIDDFIGFNKAFGFEYADKILKKVADKIKNNIDETDVLGRFGNDEFVLISFSDRKEIMSVVKNINKDIENVEVNGKRLNLSLSVGVTEMKIEDNLERLFKRAQEAVCLAKQKGGARVDYLEHFLLFE